MHKRLFKPDLLSLSSLKLVAEPPKIGQKGETGVDALVELTHQHERVSELLLRLDEGRWWSQSQPCLHADDVHAQVAVIKAALDKIDVAVEAMRGL